MAVDVDLLHMKPSRGRALVSVVVPARDEAAVLPEFHRRLAAVLADLPVRAQVVYVDDGSVDGTWEMLAGLAAHDDRVIALRLSRSFGHQAALSAGIDRAEGDAVVTLDADLQDPPELIPELVARWRDGSVVVHARRTRRRGEGILKRATAWLFHRLLRLVADVPIRVDVADFRLLDRAACEVLRAMPERHRYLRGMAAWTGFPQAEVPYERQPRRVGRTKYRLRTMVSLGLDAVVSFSRAPLRIAGWLGAVVVASSLVLMLTGALAVPLALLALLDGIVLLLLAVLGAYVTRIGDEARARPGYVVREERPLRRRRGASGGSARSPRRA
jgi:polyisoprenyl-phosphate glycosyltransferase